MAKSDNKNKKSNLASKKPSSALWAIIYIVLAQVIALASTLSTIFLCFVDCSPAMKLLLVVGLLLAVLLFIKGISMVYSIASKRFDVKTATIICMITIIISPITWFLLNATREAAEGGL